MRRWLPALTTALVIAFGALVWFGPFLARTRQFVSSTGASPPFGKVTPLGLPPGSEACMTNVTINPDAGLVQFTVLPGPRPTPPLRVFAAGPGGYRSRAVRLAGGYPAPAPQVAPITPPARSRIGRVCIRNAGQTSVSLVATTELRTSGRERTLVNGRRVAPDVQLTVLARPRRLIAGVPDVLRRMAAFKGVLVGPGVLWILAALVVLGVPAAVVLAVASATRGDAGESDAFPD